MTTASTAPTHSSAGEVLSLPDPIQQYFEAANAGKFGQMAALFADDGQLVPPFEKPVVGREAIAQYLTTEATGMKFTPLKYEAASLEESESEESESNVPTACQPCLIRGKVKTSLFVVNVAWEFVLNEAQEISSVKVKLLAKLNELLKLRS